MPEVTSDERRRWRGEATDGLALAVESAPDATIPAYPQWTARDLAVHVIRIYKTAAIALDDNSLERPGPELPVTREHEPPTLAETTRQTLRDAEAALSSCRHEVVWTPVGPRAPSFWARRLLREAILHRWDAEQAGGTASAPSDEQALDLIEEFLDTDIVRAFGGSGRAPGASLVIAAGSHRWSLNLGDGAVEVAEAADVDTATISGDPPSVWLWLMRRDGLPGQVSIRDSEGSAGTFTALIDQFNRPSR